jgi:hypothetical protein
VAYRLGERRLFAVFALVDGFVRLGHLASSHARPAEQRARDTKRLTNVVFAHGSGACPAFRPCPQIDRGSWSCGGPCSRALPADPCARE